MLDSRYLPVNVVNWGRAVAMDMSGKVGTLEVSRAGTGVEAAICWCVCLCVCVCCD